MRYTDPSGHFEKDAIYQYILNSECGGSFNCADDMFVSWQADTGWWLMLLTASAGDILYGSDSGGPGTFRFFGEGQKKLTYLEAWGGDGPRVRLSGLRSGEYKNRILWTTTHSAGWEFLVFHDDGYAVTKDMFYSAGERVRVYGSQYINPTLGSVIRTGAKAIGAGVVVSKICKGSDICEAVLSGVLEAGREATRRPFPEQIDSIIRTKYWQLHYKPDMTTVTIEMAPDLSGAVGFHGLYQPPTISSHP